MVLFFALLISYPWPVLTLGTLAYLAALPFGWMSYRKLEEAAGTAADTEAPAPPVETPGRAAAPPRERGDGGRPARLN